MKNMRIALLLMAVGLMSVSCEVEKLDTSMRIPGLGGEEYIPNEIDEWLYDNFTAPYNIEVIYRWDASQVQSSWLRPIVPVEEDSVVTFMTAIRDVWFEPYERAVGDVFLKKMTPKQVVLGGSGEYQFGAIKLGQAEGGLKILLLNVNNFDRSTDISDPEQETSPEGANCIRQFLHTIEHEFAHILHQTTMFDKTYESISAGKYNPTGWTDVEYAEAQSLGFITPYAMSGKDEDFVEMISVIMVYGREWYDDMVQKTCFQNGKLVNETAYDAFTRKEAIVVDYLKNVWGIKFYDDAEGEGIVTYVQEAINKQLGK